VSSIGDDWNMWGPARSSSSALVSIMLSSVNRLRISVVGDKVRCCVRGDEENQSYHAFGVERYNPYVHVERCLAS